MFKVNEGTVRNKQFYNACAKKRSPLWGQGFWKRKQSGSLWTWRRCWLRTEHIQRFWHEKWNKHEAGDKGLNTKSLLLYKLHKFAQTFLYLYCYKIKGWEMVPDIYHSSQFPGEEDGFILKPETDVQQLPIYRPSHFRSLFWAPVPIFVLHFKTLSLKTNFLKQKVSGPPTEPYPWMY